MKKTIVTILLIGCIHIAGHAVIEIDGVYYESYYNESASVVCNLTDEGNYVGLKVANIRDSVSFDGVTKLPVTSIHFTAFQEAPDLEEVNIPNTVTHIGEAAFNLCPKLRGITIPNSVITIDEWAVSHNLSLKELHLGSGAVNVDDYAFVGNSAVEVITVDEGNPKYDSRNNCNGIFTVINNSMVHDRVILLTACSKTVIPPEVTHLGCAAYNGQDITTVEIPSQITSIANFCFEGCEYLTSIYNYSREPHPVGAAFEEYHYDNCTLYVPRGSKEAYEKTGMWSSFLHIEEFDDEIGDIPGDVNGDGVINIVDVTSVIDIIINGGSSGHNHAPQPSDYTEGADVNGDGIVSIADVCAIIDIILKD